MVIGRNLIILTLVPILFGFYWGQDANAQEVNLKSPPKWLLEGIVSSGSGGNQTQNYFYDAKGRKQKLVSSIQNPNHQSTSTTEFFYDEAGNCTKQTTTITVSVKTHITKAESTSLMLYDSNNFIKKKSTTSSSNGKIVTNVEDYENNNKGKPVKKVMTHNNASPVTILQEFDECGNPIKFIMGNSQNETKYEYAKGKDCVLLSAAFLKNGQLTHKKENEYTSDGKLSKTHVKFTNPNAQGGNTTTVFIYDENGNKTKQIIYVNAGSILSTKTYTYRRLIIN